MSAVTSLRTRTEPTSAGRRPRRTLVIVVAAVLAAAALLTWLIAFSPVLGVGTVAVRGTRLLSTADVRRTADLTDGTPLVRVDTAAVTRRLQTLPEVASAQVSTSFPSTVEITITERTAVGYLRTGNEDELVDHTGVRYRTVHSAPDDLPLLVLAQGGGADDAAGDRTRAEVARVAASLPAALRAEVRSIQALDPDAITLVLTHDKIVRWGNAARSAAKARVLGVLLERKASQIDVTDPDLPYTH